MSLLCAVRILLALYS